MIVSFIQVVVEAVERLLEGGKTQEIIRLSVPSIIIMACTGTFTFNDISCDWG